MPTRLLPPAPRFLTLETFNIVLPDETITVLEQSLRQKLEAGYRANADRGLAIGAEWFPLEEDASASLESAKPVKSKRSANTKRKGLLREDEKSSWLTSIQCKVMKSKNTRPALIIQDDIGNRHSGTTIVAAIT